MKFSIDKKGFKEKVIKSLNALAIGVFSTLLIGLILQQVGTLFKIEFLIRLGKIAKLLMGPGIGVSVSYFLNGNPLTIVSSLVAGSLGANSIDINTGIISVGEPVGAFVASIVSTYFGNLVTDKTNMNILVIPSVSLITGGIAALFLSPSMSYLMKLIGNYINILTELHPLPMGILLSMTMGMILTLPISSAAIAISLNLSGIAAGAATIGTCCNMIGFAICGIKDNKLGSFFAVSLGTSMLQFGNIVKNPWIWLPPIMSSIILGPISTILLKLKSNMNGAGMGTSGLVGQLMMIDTMGFSYILLVKIIVMHFLLPAILSYIFYLYLLKIGKIKKGDYTLSS